MFEPRTVLFKGNETADEFYRHVVDSIDKAVIYVGEDQYKLEELRKNLLGWTALVCNIQARQFALRGNR